MITLKLRRTEESFRPKPKILYTKSLDNAKGKGTPEAAAGKKKNSRNPPFCLHGLRFITTFIYLYIRDWDDGASLAYTPPSFVAIASHRDKKKKKMMLENARGDVVRVPQGDVREASLIARACA